MVLTCAGVGVGAGEAASNANAAQSATAMTFMRACRASYAEPAPPLLEFLKSDVAAAQDDCGRAV
jgi:hypothetical protein